MRDELALIGDGERFAQLVQQIRTINTECRGLVVMLGAVLQRQLSAIDAAFPETTLISGEEPGVVERLPDIVARALAPAQVEAASHELGAALENARAEAVIRAVAQSVRSQELGRGNRSDAVRGTVAPDAIELALQTSVAREKAFEAITRELEGGFAAEFFRALLRRPVAIMGVVLALIAGLSASGISDFMNQIYLRSDIRAPPIYALISPTILITSGLLLAAGVILAIQLFLDLVEFREYRRKILRSGYDRGAPIEWLHDRHTEFVEMLSALGPRQARLRILDDRRMKAS